MRNSQFQAFTISNKTSTRKALFNFYETVYDTFEIYMCCPFPGTYSNEQAAANFIGIIHGKYS